MKTITTLLLLLLVSINSNALIIKQSDTIAASTNVPIAKNIIEEKVQYNATEKISWVFYGISIIGLLEALYFFTKTKNDSFFDNEFIGKFLILGAIFNGIIASLIGASGKRERLKNKNSSTK
jgi:hypothetical protein